MTYENAKTLLLVWAYPRLREVPRNEWETLLYRAREEDFDLFELAGIVAGVTLAAWLLHPATLDAAVFSLPVRYIVQFVAAVPLLVLLVGGLYLRRTRRGLAREIERRNRPRRGDAAQP